MDREEGYIPNDLGRLILDTKSMSRDELEKYISKYDKMDQQRSRMDFFEKTWDVIKFGWYCADRYNLIKLILESSKSRCETEDK